MKWKLITEREEKTFALVFDDGDEVVSSLTHFARERQLNASDFSGIGACARVTLGLFELERKDYKRIHIDEQVEVMSVLGNITLNEKGEPKVHGHMVVGKSDGVAYGGHLFEAHVRPTLELFLVEHPLQLQRKMNEQI
ncbi:MAG: PPC domain-containing DNA-binding protein, partial [Pyrinomonadaceae bacterium]